MLNVIVLTVGFLLLLGSGVLFAKKKGGSPPIYMLALAGLAVMILSQSFAVIPTGYTGVRSTFEQIDNTGLPPGFNAKVPFIQRITLVNNKQQDVSLATNNNRIWCESKDKVQVYMADITLTYQISPDRSAWLYANVTDYDKDLVSHDLAASALKNAAKSLTTYDVTTRSSIEPLALANVQRAVDEKYGEGTVRILMVVVNDMNFEETYNQAVEQKNIAAQKQEQQSIENQTNIDRANAEAEVARIQAEGRAMAAVAEAEGIAEANRVVADSITPQVLEWEYIQAIQQWRPQVIGDGAAYPTYSVTPPQE